MAYKEYQLQEAVARYLDVLGVLWCHVANERKTSRIKGGRLKKAGVKSGVPDCLVFEPSGDYCGLAIELKVGRNKPSDTQIQFMLDMEKKGWKTAICWDLDSVIDLVDEYLNNK